MTPISKILLASALGLCSVAQAFAQTTASDAVRDVLTSPVAFPAPARYVLRPAVTVTSDVVRIGDFLEDAGSHAQISLFRAPDLGTTGAVPVSDVIAALRTHRIIGVERPEGATEIAVTRASRALLGKDIERLIASALERRNGLGQADDLQVTTDRDLRPVQLDASAAGDIQPASTRYDPRNGRFDVSFDITGSAGAPTRLRFTGTVIETAEVAVVTRGVERGDVLRAADVSIERRPKIEVPSDAATRGKLVGMSMKRSLRSGQPLRSTDIVRPDMVLRDQSVTITFEVPGIYMTMRGKANEAGGEGDTISVTNLQSKRIVQGTITGPGQISITAPVARTTNTAALTTRASQTE